MLVRLVSALIFCSFGTTATHAQTLGGKPAGLTECARKALLAPEGRDAKLARGFNLPNWTPDYSGYKPDDSLLAQLHQLGFTHIRLPITAERTMSKFASDAEISAYLKALDVEVTRLIGLGYVVSIDMHPSRAFQNLHIHAPGEGLAVLKQAWDRIAEFGKDWPVDAVYFELLNEPAPQQSVWWQHAQKLVKDLNEVSPGRRLIVGPAVFQRVEVLASAEPLQGEGLVYAIHYYDPMVFTHQAATWMEGSPLAVIGQMPFPGDDKSPGLIAQVEKLKAAGMDEAAQGVQESYAKGWNADRIEASLASVGDWSNRHDAPVIVNEFGTLTFDVNPHDRANC